MAKKANSLSHTKWMCKYHIVFTPKYRRKVIYNQYKESIRDILKQLCGYKGVEIIEGHLMPDHIHMLVSIPPKLSVREYGTSFKGSKQYKYPFQGQAKAAKARQLERSESQRLQSLTGNKGLQPQSKPPVRRVVLIVFSSIFRDYILLFIIYNKSGRKKVAKNKFFRLII